MLDNSFHFVKNISFPYLSNEYVIFCNDINLNRLVKQKEKEICHAYLDRRYLTLGYNLISLARFFNGIFVKMKNVS